MQKAAQCCLDLEGQDSQTIILLSIVQRHPQPQPTEAKASKSLRDLPLGPGATVYEAHYSLDHLDDLDAYDQFWGIG